MLAKRVAEMPTGGGWFPSKDPEVSLTGSMRGSPTGRWTRRPLGEAAVEIVREAMLSPYHMTPASSLAPSQTRTSASRNERETGTYGRIPDAKPTWTDSAHPIQPVAKLPQVDGD